ncbi:MAG: DNA topoisomerase III [Marinobacter sp.]|nr:DNA topoisomerase III [Marinobacter sp.]
MRLYIAEKPSLAKAIAQALPGPLQRGQGWLKCGDDAQGAYVSWCIGHLLEPAEPASYDPRWQQWQRVDLPIFPERWLLSPRAGVRQQLDTLCSLIRNASLIIHAGDPDREGQLLVDEVIQYARASCPVQRVLINDLTPKAVRQALASPRDNTDFKRLSQSALARQQADWLYGINLTRLYTLKYRAQGQDGVYSVGRVQTPVLGLVAHRDQTIADFTPRNYYLVDALCEPAEAGLLPFRARWQPDERYRASLDEEDRLLDPEVANTLVDAIKGQAGTITEARFRDRAEKPPLPLSLSALQIEAGRLYQMAAKQVLDVAQSLYEKHQLITYPRSDCRYLPDAHYDQREAVLNSIAKQAPDLAGATQNADRNRRTQAWNDSKVDAHHAIIPTANGRSIRLSAPEAKVYELVCRYYLMQFYGDAIHREGRLQVDINSHLFRATETAIATSGWKELEVRRREGPQGESRPPLPKLAVGATVHCVDGTSEAKLTKPPTPFTDATLLAAMTNIARFVKDATLRKTLRDTDGLGTEATRASIIEILFKREYLFREGRFIKATEKGQALIQALPEHVAQPDMTAVWEATLESIRQGEDDPRKFIQSVKETILGLLETPQQPTPASTADAVHCPKCRAPMRTRSGRYGEFWSCSRYPQCNGTRDMDPSTHQQDGNHLKPFPCPRCYAPLVRRNSKKGWFWGCSNFPGCRHTCNDINGHPEPEKSAGYGNLQKKG